MSNNAATQTENKQIAELYAKKRKGNRRMLISLVVFVLALVALSVLVRINHIKGLAE